MITSLPVVQAGLGGLGPWELIIVLAIVMIVFGGGKLPTVGHSLGEAIRNFKKAIQSPEQPTDQPPEKTGSEKQSS